MLSRLATVAISSGAALALAAVPASAATKHHFKVPGVHGVASPGSPKAKYANYYIKSGNKVTVHLCVRKTAADVYGAFAIAVLFNSKGKTTGKATGVRLP